MTSFIMQCCILILLPIIPAIILFRGIRLADIGGANAARAEGNLLGLRWSFGGAFAGYIFVLLILMQVMSSHLQLIEAEVWTVRGHIQPGATQDIVNRVSISSFPQNLNLSQSGDYEFKIIVLRHGDTLEFPSVNVDMSLLCGGIKTVRLDDGKGTFPILDNPNPVKINKSPATHSIQVETIPVPVAPAGNFC